MNKDLNVSNLIQIYGSVLDEKIRKILDSHYNLDLSLSEISEEFGITRQGIRDIIRRNTDNLYKLDNNLKLQSKFSSINTYCRSILNISDDKKVTEEVNNIIDTLLKE